MLTDITHHLPPGISCPETFIAVQAVLSSTSLISTFCCPSTLDSLPSTLATIPAPCVSLHSAFANANPLPIPQVPTTLQTIPVTNAELKPRATTSSKTSTSQSTTSHTTATSPSSTKTSSTSSSSSASATATSKAVAKDKHAKVHFSTAVKVALAIVLIVFILTLILIGFCVYKKISRKRKGKAASPPSSFAKHDGSGLGINASGGVGGGNAYGMVPESALAAGPNGRERESGAGYEGVRETGPGYEAYRGEAAKTSQLEQERIKAGLTGPFVKP